MERTDISNNDRRTIKNSTETATSDYTFVGTLYYQGQFSERFRLYSDFSYNYYYNDIKPIRPERCIELYKSRIHTTSIKPYII